jgi:hypothetical protein
MRNEVALTDEQIETIFDRSFGIGLCADKNITWTRETIEQIEAGLQQFIQFNKPYHDFEQGFRTMEVREIKVAKGRPKMDQLVVDFGSVRAVYQGDS